MYKLGVGAVSRRVVEEAARMRVPQVVASRRQVDVGGGYTGMDQHELVKVVAKLSGGATEVVRDHGGPLTDDDDTYVDSFEADANAGFDVLHIDVCNVGNVHRKTDILRSMVKRYADNFVIEVGDERGSWVANKYLMIEAMGASRVDTVVVPFGGHIHADRQCGYLCWPETAVSYVNTCHELGVKTKAHNMDFVGRRHRYAKVDYLNVAPEVALAETDAWLQVMPPLDSGALLEYAYASRAWERWFDDDQEGTWSERARCAVRYVLEDPYVKVLLAPYDVQEDFVRGAIRDAIRACSR